MTDPGVPVEAGVGAARSALEAISTMCNWMPHSAATSEQMTGIALEALARLSTGAGEPGPSGLSAEERRTVECHRVFIARDERTFPDDLIAIIDAHFPPDRLTSPESGAGPVGAQPEEGEG